MQIIVLRGVVYGGVCRRDADLLATAWVIIYIGKWPNKTSIRKLISLSGFLNYNESLILLYR
jgi:hypothetical protein